jgi:5-hydroxyisourate hydrolase
MPGHDNQARAMPRLTTHVLNTASGQPAANLRVVLRRDEVVLADMTTGADGRATLLDGDAVKRGSYEATFHVDDYFRGQGVSLADPPFLDTVPVRFSLDGKSNAHVPLLIAPYGYSVYRGS